MTPGPFSTGSTVTFDITVFNQGNVDANGIQITDYIPAGLTLSDTNWVKTGNIAQRVIPTIAAGLSVKVSITFTIDATAANSITNLAEISSDDGNDCDSTPDTNPTNDGTITNDAIGTACEPGGDEDDHDPETIILTGITPIYDLALRKTLSSTTPGPFNSGSTVVFNIEVFNQGNVPANNIEVSDYIPTGLILNDTAWTQSGSIAKRTISRIEAGTSVPLTIRFTIAANPPSSITNLAEISSDDGNDCDSTPDTNAGNDGTPVDNAIGIGCESGGDEDDHDPETITTGTPPPVSACTNLSASATSAQNSLTSTLTCSGSGATNYKIEVKNPSGTIVETFNTNS